MATILPKSQEWLDYRDANGTIIGVHNVEPVTNSDTFKVPPLAEASTTASVKQLQRVGDAPIAVGASDADSDGAFETITLTNAVGRNVLILTLHQGANTLKGDSE